MRGHPVTLLSLQAKHGLFQSKTAPTPEPDSHLPSYGNEVDSQCV